MSKLAGGAVSLALTLTLTVSLASPARAAEPEPKASSDGYVGQVVAADATSVGLFVASALLEGPDGRDTTASDTVRIAFILGYGLGAPMVHLAHERYGRAAASLAMRVVLPILGGGIGAGFAHCTPQDFLCGLDETLSGMAVGAGVAMVLDAAVLTPGWGETASGSAAAPPPPAPRLSLTPRVVATPELAFVGVGGRF